MHKIFVFGASGHAKVVFDCIRRQGQYQVDAFIAGAASQLEGLPVLGEDSPWDKRGVRHGVIAVGDNWIRSRIAEKILSRCPDFEFVSIIHPSAVIAPSAKIGAGCVVFAGSVLNPDCEIGRHCIVNTRASIDHDSTFGDFVSLAPGATLGGTAKVGDFTAIGLGASIIHGIQIGSHVVVGAGAVVTDNIPDLTVAFGVPCKVQRSRTQGEPYLASNAAKRQ